MKIDRTNLSGLILTVLVFLGAIEATSQVSELTGKTYAQRSPLLFDFYVIDLRDYGRDSNYLFQKIDSLATAAKSAADEDLLAETQLMRIHYYFYRDYYPRNFVLLSLDTLRQTAKKSGREWLLARVESLAALTCSEKGYNYELAFVYFRQMDEVVSKLSIKDFPEKQICYYQMGYAYFEFSELENAIRYFSAGLKESPEYSPFKFNIQIHNSLGLCYQKLSKFDSSDYHFRKALSLAGNAKSNYEIWEGIIAGNLGYNQYLQNNLEAAKPLLEKDVIIAEKNGDWGLAVGSLVPLAEIALSKNQLAEANALAARAKEYTLRSNQYRRWEKVYPLLAKLAAHNGNSKIAAAFLDSSITVKDSLARKLNSMKMARALQRVDLEKHEAELALLNSEKKLKIWERNILLVGIFTLFILSAYVYRKQRKNVLRKQAELARAEKELKEASAQLDQFTRNISEKNMLIETMLKHNKGIQNETIDQLKHKTILTEDDWKNFQGLFEKVHGGYLERLKEKLSGLSPAEIRFMTLSKLGLNNKEMAATLGVGPDAVRQYRSRLRKKLQLAEDGSIEELVNSI
jgi:tetratricopeptide (TPR) repeat protein